MRKLIVIIGKSLSGKTHLQNTLARDYGVLSLITRTTRPRRFVEEEGYIFSTMGQYQQAVDECSTVADRQYHVATGDTWVYWLEETDFVFDGVKSLIIDPKGFKTILYRFPSVEIIPIFLEPGFLVRMERYVTQRSFENENEVLRRVIADEEDFKEIKNMEEVLQVKSEEEALKFIEFKLDSSNF